MLRPKKTHRTISPQEAAAAHVRGELVLVDVRESAERAVEHVEGSVHIPLAEVRELPRDTTVAFMCRSGRRGAAAAATAAKGGFDAANVRGRLLAWGEGQLPLASGPHVSGPDPKDTA